MAQKKVCASLKEALVKLDQGRLDEAVAIVTALAPGASLLLSETQASLKKLLTAEDFYARREQFLSYHLKMLAKKTKELIISKTVSESIQRTQQKKLQSCKWDLMKARNALYCTRKKLENKEREEGCIACQHLSIHEDKENDLLKLRAAVDRVQVEVNKRELECTNKENFLKDNKQRLSELREKVECLSNRSKSIKQLQQGYVLDRAKVVKIREYLNKVIAIWTLCSHISENGKTKKDAMEAISAQAREETKIFSLFMDGSKEMAVFAAYDQWRCFTNHLNLMFVCQHCSVVFKYLPENAKVMCHKCVAINLNEMIQEQKVILEFYECANDGSITGYVWVSNLAYDKAITIHHSQNGWLSSVISKALYYSSCSETGYDQFQFCIPLDATVSASVNFAICYSVNGCVFWDNNGGHDYTITL